MNDEPSLLDYLKALIDPRKERIPLPDPLLEPEEGTAVGSAPAGAPSPLVGVPVIESDDLPLPRPSGPFPWRAMLALFLALFAQAALEPPDRSLRMGVFLYLVSFVSAGWALWRGELALPRLPQVKYRLDDLSVRRAAMWAALPLSAFAFAILGGNTFTRFNLTVWLLAILALTWGFHLKTGALDRFIRKARASIGKPLKFTLSPWGLLVLAGFALVLFFRFYHLEQVPSQMFSDHAEKLQDVQDILNGETRIFFPRNTGREFVQMYLTAFTARFLGYGLTFMALKMGTALAGLLMFPFIYLLGVELANRRVGLLAVVLTGISYWLNVITRVALRFSLYPLFAAPTLYFIVRGLRRGNRNDFIWAGIFLGLGLHGYSPFRFVPIFVLVAVALFILHAGSQRKRAQAVWHLGVVVALSALVFLPLLRFMTESEANRSIVLYRSLTRIGTVEQPYPGNPAAIFADNMWRAMTMFAWEDGGTWVHSVVYRPALDGVSAALFYLGFILLLLRYFRKRQWEDSVLLLAVPFLLLPSAMSLAFPAENPSLNRTAGAMIPVFLIAALMLDAVMSALRKWAGGQWGSIAAWSAAAFLIFWSSAANYDLVFTQYNESFTMSSWNTTELGAVIRGFADSVGDEDSAWVIPWPHWVDTRLVGINAGVYIRDYALPREGISGTVGAPGSKLYLFNLQDVETLSELERLYPRGVLRPYISEVSGKDFWIFLAPAGP